MMFNTFFIFLSTIMSVTPNNKSALMEDFSKWSFLMFSLLLILSLIATFSIKTTPIHKVVALLFLSVVTVLFWSSSTHFLFVYIVYIMAFIGAVLMLFLSVVLMLPISTTSQASGIIILALSGESAKELLPPITLRPEGMIFPAEKTHFFYWIFLFWLCFVIVIKIIRVRSVFPLSKPLLDTYNEAIVQHAIWAYKEIIAKSKFYTISKDLSFIYPAYANQFFYPIFPLILKINGKYKLNWKFYEEEAFYSKIINWHNFEPQNSTFLDLETSTNYCYNSYGRCNLNPRFAAIFLTAQHPIMQKFAKIISLRDVSKLLGLCHLLNFFLYFRLRSLFIFYAVTHSREMKIFFAPLTELFSKEIPLLHAFLFELYNKLFKVSKLNTKKAFYFSFTKVFLEILLQIIAVLGFLSVLVPTVYTFLQEKKDILHTTDTVNEVSGGLGNIKELLYEDYNLLLILSTFVLLVALLGAAVMTRKKR